MVTVHRGSGFRFVIYLDDHAPAHVHAIGSGEVKIEISGDRPVLVWAHGLKRAEIRKAMRIVAEQQDEMLGRWKEIHD